MRKFRKGRKRRTRNISYTKGSLDHVLGTMKKSRLLRKLLNKRMHNIMYFIIHDKHADFKWSFEDE